MQRYLWLFAFLTFSPLIIASTSVTQIPAPLQPWVNWVLEDSSQYQCPFFYNNAKTRYCAWPSQLNFDIQEQQGTFTSDWHIYNDSYVTLPGNTNHWPQEVTINDIPVVVGTRDNKPVLKLKPGHYQIAGKFLWNSLPDSLMLPNHTGIISVSVLNKPIPFPIINKQQLWFKANQPQTDTTVNLTDHLTIHIYRLVEDRIPLQLISHISLEVSGKQREIRLPYALLSGFIPISLNSALATRLEADGSLLVQVRAGRWNIELTAQHPTKLTDLPLDISDSKWPDVEIWSFAAQANLRIVEIEQLKAIDPSQSNMPAKWKKFPAFMLKQLDTMHFNVIRRGDPLPEPNNLSISRKIWLDFTGSGYTIQDDINGQITQGWRLDSLPEMQLGQIQVNGITQLITRAIPDGVAGVELRKGRVQLVADSRVSNDISQLSATGWQEKFNQAQAVLYLPPGWHLFAVSGVDNAPNSWITRWTLLDLFIVLITALATSRLWNNYWGLFALCTLTLIWHESNAPRFIWLNILVAISLIKVLPKGNILRLMKFYRTACWVVLLIISIPFLIEQVRIGLYPQLENPRQLIEHSRSYLQSENTALDAFIPEQSAAMSHTVERKLSHYKGYSPLQEDLLKGVDPDASLQTGPGLPQWQWARIPLSWNGGVDSQQTIQFWYLDPTTSLLLNFLRVFLVLILSLLMLDRVKIPFRIPALGFKLCLSLLLILPAMPIHADYPSTELLKELKQRLLKAPDCLPSCAQIQSLHIAISSDMLTLTLKAHAQETVALPLPAQFKQWLPNSVLVDGLPAQAMIQDQRGLLWLTLSPGIHRVTLVGNTPLSSSFTLPLTLKPHVISQTVQRWEIAGLKKNGVADNQLHFTRIPTATQNNKKLPPLDLSTLPPFIRVERTLNLGLDWHISTRVLLASGEGSATTLSIPLLAGESVISTNISTNNGFAIVHLTANQKSITWQSVLAQTEQLTLKAPQTFQWHELWRVNISPIWHLNTTGITAIHQQNPSGNWLPEWRPWPGEEVTLSISRPNAVLGQTLTIDKSIINISQGKRNMEARLSIDIRSSKGTQHNITLPENAILQSVSINGITHAIRQQNQTVSLAITPGTQHFQLNWYETKQQSGILTTPELNFGIASVNTHIKVALSKDRWVLLAFGPQMGPAVLFWGVLIVLVFLAIALDKTRITPLRHWQWFLLLIGLSQIPVPMAFVVVTWLMALGFRQKQSYADVNKFNLVQLLLIVFTIGSLAILFIAVEQGLLGSPDMQIAGNQSTALKLNWYQDRSLATLPTASVISIPLMSYRIMMLFWSLWLAISLLNWLKWGWQCFSYDGLWKKSKTKPSDNNLPI